MDTVTVVMVWLRSVWQSMVDDIYSISWFFGCLLAFPILRYFFRKFLKSF